MLSAILGTFFWGILADKYGRKLTGYLTMIPYLVSWIILLCIKTEEALMISRFLGGLGASGAAINSPMYVGEISDKYLRAALGSLFILMYNVGVLYVYIFGVFVGYDWLNVACLAISVLYMIVWFYVPESPIYLIQQNKMDEAKNALKWFRGKDKDNDDKDIDEELNTMTHCGDKLATAHLSDYKEVATIKALLIGIVFQSGTQFSGINVILMYAVEIFRNSGSTLSPEKCTMLVGVMQVLGSVIASLVVNRAGRKFFLMATYVLTAVSLFVIGMCFYENQVDKTIDTGLLPVISMSIHVMAFSLGLGMVPYIVYAEIFPANVRNVCMSLLMFWNNALGFVVVKAYPMLQETMHISGCFWLFGFVCAIIVPYTYFCVPETRDKTFDVIREELNMWFPNLCARKNKVGVAAIAAEDSRVIVVTSSTQRVCMENNQDCFTAP